MDDVLVFLGALVFIIGWIWFVVAFFKKKSKIMPLFVASLGFLAVVVAGLLLTEDRSRDTAGEVEPPPEEAMANDEVVQEDVSDQKTTDALNVKGSLKASVKQNNIIVEVDTNLPDGSLLEVFITDADINTKSEFASVKNGKTQSSFEIPGEWTPAEFSAMAMFRFNSDDHPQPDHIKSIYGETGEKITGEFAEENQLGGKNANFENVTVAYPSEDAIKNKSSDEFDAVVAEAIESTEGIILDVRPRFDEWNAVDIVVGDGWYYTPAHEKERFAEQVGTALMNAVINSGKHESPVLVYFVDSHGADLATPKILGGWKIKK